VQTGGDDGGLLHPAPCTLPTFTDPDELLEVYDAEGRPSGRAKARGPVHRDGDWHLAFFCWIVRAGAAGPELVLQQRSAVKDVFPGRFDASAAGHVRFGETRAEMVREVEEELGLTVAVADLVALPWHRQQHHHPNGIRDREHHELNLLRCDRPLEAYRPSPREVSGLVSVPVWELADLAEGRRGTVETEFYAYEPDGAVRRSPLRLRHEDLVPYDGDYHRRLARRAAALCWVEGEV
jgi:isopentenyldiphosphate isomerase